MNTPEKHPDFQNLGTLVDRLKAHAQKVLQVKASIADFKASVTLQERIEGLNVRREKQQQQKTKDPKQCLYIIFLNAGFGDSLSGATSHFRELHLDRERSPQK